MKCRGKCRCDYDYQKNEVCCEAILVNVKSFTSYTSFRNTLVHEMVHQWFYQQLGEDDVRFANRCGQARSRNWWNKLTADAGRDGHRGRWLMRAEELNEAHPEPSLSKHSSEDQFDASDEEKSARTRVANTAHALIRVIHRLGSSLLKTSTVNVAGAGLARRLKRKCTRCLLNWISAAGAIRSSKRRQTTGRNTGSSSKRT